MTSTSAPREDRLVRLGRAVRGQQASAVWLALVVLVVLARIVSASFLDPRHMLNVVRQASGLGIVAIGQTVVMITGGLDLSNGMVITLVDVVAATTLNGSDHLLLPVLAGCLGIGLLVGLINGLIVTKLRVPPFVVTLGMFSVLKGISYVYTRGAPKGKIPPSLAFVGSGFIGPIPTAVVFWVIISAVCFVVLRRTTLARYLFAVGGNPATARLSGVRVERTVVLAYMASSLLAAIAGFVLAGYIGTGSLSIGDDYNLNSIAASVIGGTSFAGGVGTVLGSVGGSLFLAFLVSFLRFLGLPYSIQLMAQGGTLALAIYIYSRIQR